LTKIKNFRITLRNREIARLLKAQGLQITPALEASIEHAVQEYKSLIQPAAVFSSLNPAEANKIISSPLPENSVAVSFAAVTIGPQLSAAGAVSGADPLQTSLLKSIEQEALHQAGQFVLRLIQDQAKEEECELTQALDIEASFLPSLAGLLGIERIGMKAGETSAVMPAGSRILWTSWVPVVKTSPKKSPSAARSEKAAV
jgi:hypothetical protein